MGLIADLKRAFGRPRTRLVDLLRQDGALLERAIAGSTYTLLDDEERHCRVVTAEFTVTIGWDWRDKWVYAVIRLHDSGGHPLDPPLEHYVRFWLETQGIAASEARRGPMLQVQLRDELELVHQVVTQILCDARKVRDALFYLEGRSRGYNDVVVVAEQAPPRLIADWTKWRLSLREK